ncbi:molybdopterin biosynthesis protein [Desulfobacterales bacterium HSG16]|nr:molybdopterin biosynthesis protein [Desulfobacterales bacterium HSG16]
MKKKRNIYLKMKTREQAKTIMFDTFRFQGNISFETVAVSDAVGRILAEPVTASISSPNFHASAMDGIAVRAKNTFGAAETDPRELVIGKNAFYINTGHVLPDDTDAVIMIENVQELDENRVMIEAPVFPWQHVRKMGEDIVATELLFPRNHMITPYCTGALISGGVFSVRVRKKPKILIIPTGSELLDWQKVSVKDLKPGQVIESNSLVLGKLVESVGGSYVRSEIMSDNKDAITQAVSNAAEGDDYDMILVIGGSSAGSEDYSKEVIEKLGRVLVHGVTIMPGKPVIIGEVASKPVFGIPGYPVSGIIAFEQFVGPLICAMSGREEPERQTIFAEPVKKAASKLGIEEFLRVKLGVVDDRVIATPLPRGSGSITTITEADGIIRIPNHVEGLNEREPVETQLLRSVSDIRQGIVIVGSHDNTLDVLSDCLKAADKKFRISSSHVGSMGGLMAVKTGVCHAAGCHLLDTNDGTYNISWIKRFIKNIEVKLVNLVFRNQGLIVAKGNPKNITGFSDLCRKNISFINRQSGSGTRILLDYHLGKLGLNPSEINGYENEEFTHMSVAVAVLSQTADAGLGICAAARALDLDFIPMATEQYDLIIPSNHFESESIQTMLTTIRSDDFKQKVMALGGYDTEKTGNVINI